MSYLFYILYINNVNMENLYFHILDLIWPRACIGCGNRRHSYICRQCFTKYISVNKLNEQRCVVCGFSSSLGQTHRECNDLTFIDQTLVFAKYDGILKKLLTAGKYSGHWSIYPELAQYCERHFHIILRNLISTSTLVTSVPLHKSKLIGRGYNQAEIIAKFISKQIQIPYRELILRNKYTETQVQKTKTERYTNLLGAFSPISKELTLSEKTILLVDDVLTTGATLNNCAKVLKDLGAFKVICLVVASER